MSTDAQKQIAKCKASFPTIDFNGALLTKLGLNPYDKYCEPVVKDLNCFYPAASELNTLLKKLGALGKKSSSITWATAPPIATLDDAYKAAHVYSGYAEQKDSHSKPSNNVLVPNNKTFQGKDIAEFMQKLGSWPKGLPISGAYSAAQVCNAYKALSAIEVVGDSNAIVANANAKCAIRNVPERPTARYIPKNPVNRKPQQIKVKSAGSYTMEPFIATPSGMSAYLIKGPPRGGGTEIELSGTKVDYDNKDQAQALEAVSQWVTSYEVKDLPDAIGLLPAVLQKLSGTSKLEPVSRLEQLKTEIDALEWWTKELLKSYNPGPEDTKNLNNVNALIVAIKNLLSNDGLTSCAKAAAKGLAEIQRFTRDKGGVSIAHGAGPAASRAAAAAAALSASVATGGGLGAATIEITRDIEYKEQCILQSVIAPLSQYRRNLDLINKTAFRPLPYVTHEEKNAPLVVDGESFGFMNMLTQAPGMAEFFDMTNAEIAGLQPLMRLYKVSNANIKNVDTKEQEIAFDSHAKKDDVDSIFNNKDKRGFGVGIKSFNFVFDGQDMFAQKKSIKATLKIQATSFSELLKPRGGYRYVDLALKTGKTVAQQRPEMDDLNFRLKAVFGWTPITNSILRDKVESALKHTFVSVNLTPVTHNFDFDELGRVTFTIEYFAYVEEFYDKPRMNIFTHAETYAKILSRKLAFETAELDAKCDDDEKKLREQIAEIKKADAENVLEDKRTMLSNLFKKLIDNNDVYFLNLSREELRNLISQGPYYKFNPKVNANNDPLSTHLQGALAQQWRNAFAQNKTNPGAPSGEAFEASLLVGGVDSVTIPYFYIGDLLNLIMGDMATFLEETKTKLGATNEYTSGNQTLEIDKELKEEEMSALEKSIKEFKKFRLLLGPLEIVDHANDSSVYINFSDVPISVKYMDEWLTSKLLKKDRAFYPLTQFLKDLFNDLIRQFMNNDSCYPFSIKQKVRLFQSVVTSYPDRKTPDEISHVAKNLPGHRLNLFNKKKVTQPVLNISGKAEFNRPNPGGEMNYFVFYGGRTQPMNLMNGKRSQDERRGIFHYVLGKDRGIVKNIQLNKTSAPGLKEVRFEQEGYDGLRQLREIYDVEIDSYANVRAFPGNYVFVDPKGFDPSLTAYSKEEFDLTDLGVGGYYMIIRAEHDFAPGVANTKLTAVWVAAITSENNNNPNRLIEESAGANNRITAKCRAKKAAGAMALLNENTTGTDATALAFSGNKVEISENVAPPPPSPTPTPPATPGPTTPPASAATPAGLSHGISGPIIP